jgi:NADH-ubiquinone oxidoreductase chain 5
MYLSIIILPFLGALISGLVGRKIGSSGSLLITCTLLGISTLCGLVAFYEVALCYSPVKINLINWISSEQINITWGFNFDSLTVSMFLAVLIVSFLVHIYSIEYMRDDPHKSRFFSYLSMFTWLMLILITADNYFLMFVGWEGVGISSFLLVSFWFTRREANISAISAILYNRVGDMFLTIGMFLIIFIIGDVNYSLLFALSPYINKDIVTIIGILLLLGAMAKSAQIGLHVWLPQAMEGPTPVSALIHAATMVTAGIYLLIRSSPLMEYSSLALLITLWIGALTALFAGCCGLFMNDIKRIIAYSTMSQLGYMAVAASTSSYGICLFHLVNHAFFKASLFMAAGGVIHAMNDNQSLFRYGGLSKILPLSSTVIYVASAALIAAPFTSGYYSKELIISASRSNYIFSNNIIYWIITITALLTLLYSTKLIYYTFLSPSNSSLSVLENAHESGYFMSLPLIILSFLSIFSGYLLSDLFVGLGSNFLSDAIFIHPNHANLINTEFGVPTIYKLIPLIFTFLGITIFMIMFEFYPNLSVYYSKFKSYLLIYRFFNQRFWFETIVNNYIVSSSLSLAYSLNKNLDRGALELIGPYGLSLSLYRLSNNITKADTGLITNYSLYMFIALTFYLIISYLNVQTNLLLSLLIIWIFGLISPIIQTKLIPK